MATIQPKGENLRQSVKWISAAHEESPHKDYTKLIEEACFRFNLTPKEEAYLLSFYKNEK